MLFLFWVKVKAINQYTPLMSAWNNTNILEQKTFIFKACFTNASKEGLTVILSLACLLSCLEMNGKVRIKVVWDKWCFKPSGEAHAAMEPNMIISEYDENNGFKTIFCNTSVA